MGDIRGVMMSNYSTGAEGNGQNNNTALRDALTNGRVMNLPSDIACPEEGDEVDFGYVDCNDGTPSPLFPQLCSGRGDQPPVVIDIGSGVYKAGFAGDALPRTFPTVIGKSKRYITPTSLAPSTYIGTEAEKRRCLKLEYPIEYGLVTRWDDMEAIWRHTFDNVLYADPQDQPLMLSVKLENLEDRKRICQIMFEGFDVPGLFIEMPPVLSLYASKRRQTGLVVDCGEGMSQIVPVYQGSALPHAITRAEFSGHDLTHYMRNLILENHAYNASTSKEMEDIRQLKEKLCFAAADYRVALARSDEFLKTYNLLSGESIEVSSERFECPEVLFQPELVTGRESNKGIAQCVIDSILKCDIGIRDKLMANVVLAGGTTTMPGFAERLEKEIEVLCSRDPELSGRQLNVISPENRGQSAWYGGARLANSSTFQDMCVKHDEYYENGDNRVVMKFF